MDFRVEKLDLKDLDKFFELFERSVKTQFPEFTKNTIRYFLEVDYRKEWLRSALEKQSKVIFAARNSRGEMAGFLLATRPYGGVAFCNWLAVDDRFQGKGAGSALLDKWEKMVKEQGAHVVHLWASDHNIKFYKNRGYILVGRVPHNYYGSEDFFFYKELQKPKESNYLREFLKKK